MQSSWAAWRLRGAVLLVVLVCVVWAMIDQATTRDVSVDWLDLEAAPFEPGRFPDDNIVDALASAGGDAAATGRLIERLTPFMGGEVTAADFEDVALALEGEQPLEVRGVAYRSEEELVVLASGRTAVFLVSVVSPPDQPAAIDGLSLTPVFEPLGSAMADVEVVVFALAAGALVLVGLGQGRPSRWYLLSGLLAVGVFAELLPWPFAQNIAFVALPLALVSALVAVGDGRAPVVVVASAATAALASVLPVMAVDPGAGGLEYGHLLTVRSLVGHIDTLQVVSAAAALVAAAFTASWIVVGPMRRGLAGAHGVLWRSTGALVACAMIAGVATWGLVQQAPLDLTASGWLAAALVAAAAGRGAELLGRQAALGGVAARVADLGAGRERDLSRVVARALDDPTARLLYPVTTPGTGSSPAGYVDAEGRPAALPVSPDAYTVLRSDDATVGVLVHDAALRADPERLGATCDAVRLSLENERLTAQIRNQLHEVQASRQRLVQAEEQARRRLERDLHDGAQQRLVAALLALGVVQAQARQGSPELAGRLDAVADEFRRASADIRELARGVRPAALDGGLLAGIEELAERATLPVVVRGELAGRAAPEIETAAWFVVSEALANVARHAAANHAEVTLSDGDGWLRVRVDDDGLGPPGPAEVERGVRPTPASGTGLVGVFDRVEALGGTLTVRARPEGGTSVEVELPCEP